KSALGFEVELAWFFYSSLHDQRDRNSNSELQPEPEAIMADALRYYIAHNGGLKIMQTQGGSLNTCGEFFAGKTLEHLIGCHKQPGVVFAAVAFGGGFRTLDAGKTGRKILGGGLAPFTMGSHVGRKAVLRIHP